MAGDWIRMRTSLDRDPRVIRMADFLAQQRQFMDWLSAPARRTCDNSAYEHVTRNVTVALCVTALLVTWGVAREQGDRVEDDLVIEHCSMDALSAIAGVPAFGDAMELVGWAQWATTTSIMLPKFFEETESPDERHKRQAAERQARFRANQEAKSNVSSNAPSNAGSNVTVTHREEKRREEKSKSKATETIVSAPVEKLNGHEVAGIPVCPHQKIVAMYKARFPNAIHPRQWDPVDAVNLQARWKATFDRLKFTDEQQGLEWFETLFDAVAASDFLMGRSQSSGRKPFRLRLQWITKRENFKKIVEGFYE